MGGYDDAGLKKTNSQLYYEIQNAKKDWQQAYQKGDQAGMEAAHQKAEQIRDTQGYSGGEDGSRYLQTEYGMYQQSLKEAADQAAQAYWQAAQMGIEQLRSQRPQLEGGYNDLAKQAYANYMQEKRKLPETLGKLGLTGQGTAETTAARQSGEYMNLQSDIMQQKSRALEELQNKIAEREQGALDQGAQTKAQAVLQAAKWYPEYLAAKKEQENLEIQRKTDRQTLEAQIKREQEKAENQKQADRFDRQMELLSIIAKLEAAGADTTALRALLQQAGF